MSLNWIPEQQPKAFLWGYEVTASFCGWRQADSNEISFVFEKMETTHDPAEMQHMLPYAAIIQKC